MVRHLMLTLPSLYTLRLILCISPLPPLPGDICVSIEVVESTISATATIKKSCDERLDVEKRFPSLVGYFFFHVEDILLGLVHTLT